MYGPDNHLRLTGLHETQAIDKFSYGLSDRGASIRMPVNFIKNGYKGYLEDRRPNSEGDPYQIVSRILKTINSCLATCSGHGLIPEHGQAWPECHPTAESCAGWDCWCSLKWLVRKSKRLHIRVGRWKVRNALLAFLCPFL